MRGGHNFKDLEGMQFGRLHVLHRADDYTYKDGKRRVRWMCECQCGKILPIFSSALLNGSTTSCNCLQKELLSKKTWKGFEEISGVYWARLQHDAAKRNIEWNVDQKHTWQLFLNQDRLCAMTRLPIRFERNFKKHGINQTASLDRIDSLKGYTEGNIQWVHKDINLLKWDWPLERFFELCELVVKNKANYLADH